MSMDFASRQRNPAKHLAGIAAVVVLHIIIVYALMTGLARKVVEVIKQPLEAKIIEEVKAPPPPPPEVKLPPPPKFNAPPPPFIPPPEVQVAAPPVQNVIATTVNAPPPVAPGIAAPRVAEAAPAAAAPATVKVGVACPNSQKIQSELQYPRDAMRDGITGEVLVEFTVTTAGEIKDMAVAGSANRMLARAALAAARQFSCTGQGRDVRVQVPFVFKLE